MRYANGKGIALAVAVLVIEAGVVAFGLSLDATTPPTALLASPDALAPLKLPVDPNTVVPHDEAGGDAVTPIRAAIDDYLADPSRYEAFIGNPDRAQIARLPALRLLLSATHAKDGRGPLADRIDQVVVYGDSATVAALQRVGDAAIKAGEVLQKDRPDEAWRYFEAAFSLGQRAFDERLSYRELNAGMTLMSTSATWLGALAQRTGRAAEAVRIDRFNQAIGAFAKARTLPTIEAIYSFNDAKITAHAGDIFAFATRSDERLWTIEAILKLGRMRFNAGTSGDQKHAARLSASIESDDPAVQRALALARGLTVEQYRTLR